MTERCDILLSSAGRRVALLEAFRETLRTLGLAGDVMASDMSKLSSAFHAANRAFTVPPCSDEAFVPELLAICRAEGVRLLVPTIDSELRALARSRDLFAAVGTTVAVSDSETVEIAADKVRTHSWLGCEQIPTVRQGTAAEVLADPDGWPFPLVVKPRRGSAGRGVTIVANRTELERALATVDEVVVQTLARGAEYTLDVLVDGSGTVVCAVPRRRLEVRAGEVSKGVTVRRASLQRVGHRVGESLPGAFGALTIQVFQAGPDDVPQVIEINPRFGGGLPLSRAAGADFPRWLVEDVVGLPSTASTGGWQDGLVMLRYDDAVFVTSRDAGIGTEDGGM